MGVCLSCLGLRDNSNDGERTRLLSDDPYNTSNGAGYGAGAWGQAGTSVPGIPPQNILSPEEAKREQQAMDNIMRWASDQIVEIFPHGTTTQQRNLVSTNSSSGGGPSASTADQQQQQQRLANGVSSPNGATSENGHGHGNGNGNMIASTSTLQHQDILMSMIPGDKSKRSIRIYPASRPTSQDTHSVRSKASQSKLNGNGAAGGSGSTRSHSSGVFVKLDVDLP